MSPRDFVDLEGVRRAREGLRQLVEEHPELKTPAAQERLERYLEEEALVNVKPPAERRSELVTVRLNGDELARVQRLAGALEEQTPGIGIASSTAARTALLRGLATLEVELGLTKKTRAKK